MATKTDIYELRKKEENDFYTIDDFNDNMDTVETALTTFDDTGTVEGITSFTDMLTKMVTGNKLAITLRNLKAGLRYVLHTGSIVNNCVTDNVNLPLAAAQGKALQDQLTKLNSDLGKYIGTPFISSKTETNTYTMPYTCSCLVIQYGNNNPSDIGTLTLNGNDLISKATSTLQFEASGYCRLIPIGVSNGDVFKITSDAASIIF